MLSPRRLIEWSLAVFLAVTILSTVALVPTGATAVGSFPVDSAGSWNPNVPCSSPWIVRISDITNNMTGTNSYSSSPFSPGITENPYVSGSQGAKRWLTPGATPTGWHSPGPQCTVTNANGQIVAAFVEIDGVGRGPRSYADCQANYDTINGGSAHPPGHWCDDSGNLFDPSMVPSYSISCTSASDPTCYGRLHVEFDQDWMAAGYCGVTTTYCNNNTLVQQTVQNSATSLIDVQGYVFWDNGHVNETWHSYSGWELHPLTAWRPHQTAPPPAPDFSIAANPTTMTLSAGSSGTSTITLTSINGFSGTVSLSASVSSSGVSLSSPNVGLNPSSITLASNGSGTATMTVSTSLLTTPGTYTVTVDAVSGSISHSTTVTVTVGLPI